MEQPKKSIRLLNFIEEKGNKLPDPVTIFISFHVTGYRIISCSLCNGNQCKF